MKRIGIITHYYKSENYGGNLQAYALTAYLHQNGYDAEQIAFQADFSVTNAKKKRSPLFALQLPFRIVRSVVIRGRRRLEEKKHRVSQRRSSAFAHFNAQVIPHSRTVYGSENIGNCVDDYDAFITGSDQVWNLKWYNPEFFLDFVPSNKTKIAYAASLASEHLTDSQKMIFRDSLRDFRAVSVREKEAVSWLDGLSPVPVENTLDPTLLLGPAEWDRIVADRLVPEDYLFCYFLGGSKSARKLARRFAQKNKLKLVTIPHAGSWIKIPDIGFGDVQCFDATPADFVSLIKHANYIFTDSFHAVVFSHIYQKQYCVFNRNKDGEMSSRIRDITELFRSADHFCCDADKESMKYITSLKAIDYSQANPVYEKLVQESVAFLKKALDDHSVEDNAGKK